MVFATLAFLGAFGDDQGLLTYFADLSGPGLPYFFEAYANSLAMCSLQGPLRFTRAGSFAPAVRHNGRLAKRSFGRAKMCNVQHVAKWLPYTLPREDR